MKINKIAYINELFESKWVKSQKKRYNELVHNHNRLVDKHNSFYKEAMDRVKVLLDSLQKAEERYDGVV